MNKAQDIIKDFFLKTELEDFVANLLFEEFLQPGLILLPSGNTFEESIYPKVNDFFAETQFQAFNVATQETKTKEIKKQVHPQLKLSHLDELVTENNSKPFAEAIQKKLFNICKNNFTEIDTKRLEDFDEFLKSNGPRVIVAGLGQDAQNAHFAFIGEEFINSETCKINLSQEMQAKHHCQEAVTIGTDILEHPNLEKIYVVISGEDKALSLKNAFADDTTGLGYVIAKHSDKLTIFADAKSLSLI
jgi:6-phosphogluconolactonase/glucosamine-6-phosphate isomerase/deaminase